MVQVVSVAAGGALGALLRYLVSLLTTRTIAGEYPWATFIVNLLGAFIIGFLWGIFERSKVSTHIKSFVLVGIIGSFTTFSTLSLDAFKLMQAGQTKLALTHLTVTNILGLALVIGGYVLAQKINKLALA